MIRLTPSSPGQQVLDLRAPPRSPTPTPRRTARRHQVAGLFAGIGGIERGLARAGHTCDLLCENDVAATAVLRRRFPRVALATDVRDLHALPPTTTLLTAGFPCQDLSQAGRTAGIAGSRSGLVGEVFRLLRDRRIPWLLLENVPFMLQLARGRAMEVIASSLEELGYRWAYRVVDARAFGLPQRRRRVYVVAALADDPRQVLFADECAPPDDAPAVPRTRACGFYWTEGVRGLGWAEDAVPTLKGGSTIGIPSPPAIWLPDGRFVQPDIRDAERLQGFPAGWTSPAESVARPGTRWKLVGNAVCVPVAEWIGRRLSRPAPVQPYGQSPLRIAGTWPPAAWNVDGERLAIAASEWPERRPYQSLATFLRHPPKPLSRKAAAGFLDRAGRGNLRFPPGFLDAVRQHVAAAGGAT